jgi:uncharacterized protein (TIGR02246 family)
MKTITTCLALLFLTSSAAFSQEQSRGRAEQEVSELNRQWATAINKGDAKALERLFADDIIVTSGGGQIRDKAGEIKDAAGAPDPEFAWTNPFTTEDVRVRVYNEAAVVTGLAKWGFKYKGSELNNERRYTHMYVKIGSEWKIVAQQTSTNLYKKPQTTP